MLCYLRAPFFPYSDISVPLLTKPGQWVVIISVFSHYWGHSVSWVNVSSAVWSHVSAHFSVRNCWIISRFTCRRCHRSQEHCSAYRSATNQLGLTTYTKKKLLQCAANENDVAYGSINGSWCMFYTAKLAADNTFWLSLLTNICFQFNTSPSCKNTRVLSLSLSPDTKGWQNVEYSVKLEQPKYGLSCIGYWNLVIIGGLSHFTDDHDDEWHDNQIQLTEVRVVKIGNKCRASVRLAACRTRVHEVENHPCQTDHVTRQQAPKGAL